MKIIDCSLNELRKMAQLRPIVCYGAGMMPLYIEPVFLKYGLWDKIFCFVDGDESKEGKYIGEEKTIPIISKTAFLKQIPAHVLLLITCEAYIPVMEELEKEEKLRNTDCIIYPRVNRYEINKTKPYFRKKKQDAVIPKVIHYCWFGKGEMNEIHERCLQSWRESCPDYEIVRWDESNYDIAKCLYMKQAYERKKWAFATDYARLDILYENGGIYLDTDVELLKDMDVLLSYDAFISYGEWPAVNSGAGIGAKKGMRIIKEMRDTPRSKIPFIKNDKITNSVYESRVLRRNGLIQDFREQEIKGLVTLPPTVFAPVSVLGEKTYVTDSTIGIHHCNGSWTSKSRKEDLSRSRKHDIVKYNK